jgi:hypothetical protein
VPAERFGELAGDDGCNEGAKIDHRGIDLECGGAAAIVLRVQLARLRLQIAAETARACDEEQQRQEERLIEGEAEMARGHQ